MMEIQTLAWDRHTYMYMYVEGLNQLMESRPKSNSVGYILLLVSRIIL